MNSDELVINLKSLQRFDVDAVQILDTSAEAAVYSYNAGLSQWDKAEIEGALFVYRRRVVPFHAFMVLNRLNTTNKVEYIAPGLQFHSHPPYLLYRTPVGSIYGIWFHIPSDNDRITRVVTKLSSLKAQDVPAVLPPKVNGSANVLTLLNNASNKLNHSRSEAVLPAKDGLDPHASCPSLAQMISQPPPPPVSADALASPHVVVVNTAQPPPTQQLSSADVHRIMLSNSINGVGPTHADQRPLPITPGRELQQPPSVQIMLGGGSGPGSTDVSPNSNVAALRPQAVILMDHVTSPMKTTTAHAGFAYPPVPNAVYQQPPPPDNLMLQQPPKSSESNEVPLPTVTNVHTPHHGNTYGAPVKPQTIDLETLFSGQQRTTRQQSGGSVQPTPHVLQRYSPPISSVSTQSQGNLVQRSSPPLLTSAENQQHLLNHQTQVAGNKRVCSGDAGSTNKRIDPFSLTSGGRVVVAVDKPVMTTPAGSGGAGVADDSAIPPVLKRLLSVTDAGDSAAAAPTSGTSTVISASATTSATHLVNSAVVAPHPQVTTQQTQVAASSTIAGANAHISSLMKLSFQAATSGNVAVDVKGNGSADGNAIMNYLSRHASEAGPVTPMEKLTTATTNRLRVSPPTPIAGRRVRSSASVSLEQVEQKLREDSGMMASGGSKRKPIQHQLSTTDLIANQVQYNPLPLPVKSSSNSTTTGGTLSTEAQHDKSFGRGGGMDSPKKAAGLQNVQQKRRAISSATKAEPGRLTKSGSLSHMAQGSAAVVASMTSQRRSPPTLPSLGRDSPCGGGRSAATASPVGTPTGGGGVASRTLVYDSAREKREKEASLAAKSKERKKHRMKMLQQQQQDPTSKAVPLTDGVKMATTSESESDGSETSKHQKKYTDENTAPLGSVPNKLPADSPTVIRGSTSSPLLPNPVSSAFSIQAPKELTLITPLDLMRRSPPQLTASAVTTMEPTMSTTATSAADNRAGSSSSLHRAASFTSTSQQYCSGSTTTTSIEVSSQGGTNGSLLDPDWLHKTTCDRVAVKASSGAPAVNSKSTVPNGVLSPLTQEQMARGFQYLLKTDKTFVTKLHEAYLESLEEEQ